jgi:Cu2+-exporting ATPase
VNSAALPVRDHWASVVDGEGQALLSVTGIHCANCERTVRRALQAVEGVQHIDVNVLQRRVAVNWLANRTTLTRILGALDAAGFPAAPVASRDELTLARTEQRRMLKRIGLAALASMQLMMYMAGLYFGFGRDMSAEMSTLMQVTALLITTPVLFYSGMPILAGAWRDLRAGLVGMDAAVSLALLLAYAASIVNMVRGAGDIYFDSVAMFVLFLLTGRYLEARQRHQATGVGDALARSLPQEARRVGATGQIERIPVEQIAAGDRLMVAAGTVFPADGEILQGTTSAAESLLTGESTPVAKSPGSRVIGGSINLGQPVTMTASDSVQQSTVALLARLLAQQQSARTPLTQLADRIARHFVAIVILLSIVTLLAWWYVDPSQAFPAMLAVLVVSCPCALSLAAPAAQAAATAALARRGILVLRPGTVEALARVDTLLLDKTGTLTRGLPGLVRADSLDGRPIEQHQAVAAALERHSQHALALAFRSFGQTQLLASDVQEIPGSGLEGVIHDRTWRIGRFDWVNELSRSTVPASQAGIWLGSAAGLSARFQIDDALRPGIPAALAALRAHGLSIEILSGDHPETVNALAARLGIVEARGGIGPEGKLAHLKDLQRRGRTVAVVGDGINDSPVLAAADVSIAMSSGAELAQAASDMVLLREDFGALAAALDVTRAAQRRVRENLAWAAVYNLAAIPFAALGLVSPWVAALGMSASSLLVVWNATRLPEKT